MDYISAVILGVVQGLTEFLPVSSSGHLILARDFFGLQTTSDLAVDAVLQLSTVLAVGIYFWRDLRRLLVSFFQVISGHVINPTDRTLLFAIILGTIPALLAGLFLEEYMETVFRSSLVVAVMLLLGSALMFLAEKFGKQLNSLSISKGVGIGLFQTLALIPGMSRSGATISGGLLFGLSREEATRFSFLLSFPIILGSGLKKFIELGTTHTLDAIAGPLALAFILAFAVGIASIHFLIRYLRHHSLMIFIYYRALLALFVLGFSFFY